MWFKFVVVLYQSQTLNASTVAWSHLRTRNCGPKRFGEARERRGMHRPWPWKGRARHEETREPRKMPEMDRFPS